MPRRVLSGIMACLAGLAVTGASAAEWSGSAAVAFHASSTLHDFSGSVTAANVRVTTDGTGPAMTWIASGEVAVTNMSTAHSGRDVKMMEMFGATQWPMIRAATLPRPTVNAGATGCTVRVEIKGVTNDIPATVSNWKASADALSFDVAFPVSLKAFTLRPPSVVGLIRVADRVEVQGTVNVKPSGTTP